MATTRFAPSPTGALHLGHAYAAAFAAAHGRFLLRIEDLDAGRAREGHVAGIEADLAWLGLSWEQPVVRQSARGAAYAAALARLGAIGLLYPCFCTRRDIVGAASAPHGVEAVYPGTCRAPGAGGAARARAGEVHALRLDMAAAAARVGALAWEEQSAGVRAVDPGAHGDVVLRRKDGGAAYHLAVVVDDAAAGVTLVTRGVDLAAATGVQRVLQALLALPEPAYRHHALVVGADGARLAKRAGSAGLAGLRAAGVDGRALARDIVALAPGADGAICIEDGWAEARMAR